MNSKLRYWFARHGTKITWFIIGWMVTSGIRDLFMGNFVGAALSFVIAYVNYALND